VFAVLVFNLPALGALLLAGGVFAAAELGGYSAWRLVAGFGIMAIAGAALELKPAWRPRYFWIIPAWLVGLVGAGIALIDMKREVAGYVALGVAGAGVIAMTIYAAMRKPGGKWLMGVVGASTIVAGFQVIGYARPEWKHPVLYVVNAIALVAAIVCGVKLHRVRATSG
jgi:hypothetical protein